MFGAELAVRTVFEAPTVAALSRYLERGVAQDALGPVLALRPTGTGTPLFCVNPAFGLSWCYAGLLAHVDRDVPVYGLQSRRYTEPDAAPIAFDALVDDYVERIRGVQPHGPYALLGWSFGGTAAHAVAVRLQDSGERVAFLASLDGYPATGGADLPLLDPGDPGLWPAIVASMGHDPASPDSPLAGIGPGGLDTLARVFAEHGNLRRRFRSAVFDGDMLFFVATADRVDPPNTAAWHPHVTGTVEVHEVATAHGTMTQPDPLARIGRVVGEHLGRRLRSCVNRNEDGGS